MAMVTLVRSLQPQRLTVNGITESDTVFGILGSGFSITRNLVIACPKARVQNALYHRTSGGNRQEGIFWSDDDDQVWLAMMAHVCELFNWRVYACCLMSNHYHLVVQTPQGNLSAGMRQLNSVYTQRSNRADGRNGHVFQGRFKAILVDLENYLLELSR
jgi:REP element-mobilizing transposase RayT